MAYDPPSNSSRISRALNVWWQVNQQRGATISYNVQINTSATLVAGIIGSLFLETGTSSDGGVTVTIDTDPLDVQRSGLNAGLLNPGGPQTVKVSGPVTINYYARIRPVNDSGTATFSNPRTGTANSAYGWELYNG